MDSDQPSDRYFKDGGIIIWGETGTRQGASSYQLASVAWLWSRYGITQLHDGDCVGVDEQLFYLARAFSAQIVVHPPASNSHRAFVGRGCGSSVTYRSLKPYLERDRDVVDESEVVVACPNQSFESEGMMPGGTWYTIYYARQQGKPLAVVWPNGLVTYERWSLEQLH